MTLNNFFLLFVFFILLLFSILILLFLDFPLDFMNIFIDFVAYAYLEIFAMSGINPFLCYCMIFIFFFLFFFLFFYTRFFFYFFYSYLFYQVSYSLVVIMLNYFGISFFYDYFLFIPYLFLLFFTLYSIYFCYFFLFYSSIFDSFRYYLKIFSFMFYRFSLITLVYLGFVYLSYSFYIITFGVETEFVDAELWQFYAYTFPLELYAYIVLICWCKFSHFGLKVIDYYLIALFFAFFITLFFIMIFVLGDIEVYPLQALPIFLDLNLNDFYIFFLISLVPILAFVSKDLK